MFKKILWLFIGLLFVLLITGCPEIPKEEDDKDNGFTLSGDIIADFTIENPTHTVTISLLPDGNPASPPLYTTTANVWRTSKLAIIEPPTVYRRYTSYSISGIAAGTYYIYAVIDPATSLYCDSTSGPTEINISSNVSGSDIDFCY